MQYHYDMLSLNEKKSQFMSDILCLTNENLDRNFIPQVTKVVGRYGGSAFKSKPLEVLMEILRLSKKDLDLDYISKVVAAIKFNQDSINEDKGFKFVMDLILSDANMDINYLSQVLELFESVEDGVVERVKDSLSENQFKSKQALIEALESHKILTPQSTVVIWGCWYGTILIPYLQKKVARIIGIDIDEDVIRYAKKTLFYDYKNLQLIADDIFSTYRSFYLTTDLIINTSCEHMAPMKEWHWFKHGAIATDPVYRRGAGDRDPSKKRVFSSPKLSENCHFVFQSNNMRDIPDHINCVSSLEEFKAQLPKRAEVLLEDQIEEERGTRFMLMGKFK